MFLLLHLGIFGDATEKNIRDDKIPVLGAPWILWNVAEVAVEKSLVIKLPVQNAKMKERTGKNLADQQNCVIESYVGGKYFWV